MPRLTQLKEGFYDSEGNIGQKSPVADGAICPNGRVAQIMDDTSLVTYEQEQE